MAQAWTWDSPDDKDDITTIQAFTLAQLGLATYGARQSLTPFVMS